MTAQIRAFLQAKPVHTPLSRAARWDQLKVHIQDAARGYFFTFHAQHTGQLRVLRVRASQARAAYVASPSSQQALDELRHTAAALQQHRQQQAATDALRAGVLLSRRRVSSYCTARAAYCRATASRTFICSTHV